VVIDYAHNPSGLSLLMAASLAERKNNQGRIGLLLGQAGNRGDDAIKQLAKVAASYKLDLIILKELSSMLRGRVLGEVPALLRAALVAKEFPATNIIIEADEVDAARRLLEWAQPNDILIMPIHQQNSRAELVALLNQLQAMDWRAYTVLPGRALSL
jgi:cyanophycin synthetase